MPETHPEDEPRALSVVEIQQRVRAELARLGDVVEPLGRLFAEEGEEISLVGGPVRDMMLGRLQSDLDLTTSARPEVTERLLKAWAGTTCASADPRSSLDGTRTSQNMLRSASRT